MPPAPPPPSDAMLAAVKAQNLGHRLLRAARLYNAEGVARARGAFGLPTLTAAHLQVIPHLDLAGTRATVLAQRMGISKQAVGQLLDELEGMGLVERAPDPADGRARVVRFTALGREGILVGLQVLAGIERELVASVGAERLDRLREDLGVLLAALEGLDRAPD